MDPGSSTPLISLLILIALHAFFAAADIAIVSIHKPRLAQLVEQGHRPAHLVARLAEDATRLLATTQLTLKLLAFLAVALAASTYADVLAGWLAGLNPAWSSSFSHSLAVLLITVVLVFLMLIVGELLPKTLAARHPEVLAFMAIYPLSAVSILASPLARLVTAFSRWLTRSSGAPTGVGLSFVTEEEIKTLVDAGEEGGVLEEEEKEMIYSIFELGDTLAREVMVPRIDMVAIEADASIDEALAVIMEAGHSRIPVYEGSIDNIVGILYAKDLLRYWNNRQDLQLKQLLREPYFIPETKKADELLQELQRRKVHMAIVVDEYGGTAGLVTIEDILEEIVGEIQDEYDTEEAMVQMLGPGEAVFDGRIDIDDVNHLLDVNLPTEESDTLAGLIYSRLGRVPVVGDRVQCEQVELVVTAVAGRRIKSVKAVRPPRDSDRGKAAAQSTEETADADEDSGET